jgi:hypothetical protein
VTLHPGTTLSPSGRRHLAAGLIVGGVALVAAYVAALLVAAAVNPGYDPHLYYLKGAVPALAIAAAISYGAAWLLGAGRLVAVVAAVVVLAGMTAVVFAHGFASQPDREADVARDVAFKRTIAPYPGSTLVDTLVLRHHPDGDMVAEGFLNPSPGYSATLTYRLPAGATKQLAVAHYRRELERHGWETRVSGNCSGDDIVYEVCGQRVIEALDTDGNTVVWVDVYRRRADGRVFVDV